MVVYFHFGYHGIDAWSQVKADPDFDYESTGFLRIVADDEAAAFKWGIAVVSFFMTDSYSAPEGLYLRLMKVGGEQGWRLLGHEHDTLGSA